MQFYRHLINEIKEIINRNALLELQEFYSELDLQDSTIPWDYVFQKIYLHACLKKKLEIKSWLERIFLQFNPMQQIAIRQTFSYGNYLFHLK